jgi:hypothetical protein
MSDRRMIEIRGFKWPRRRTAVAMACLLGADEFGKWLGITKGSPWWDADADHSRSGVFETSFVKVVPSGTFWTACFNPINHVIDVDIVLPVHWIGDVLEEVDLELDIVRSAGGGARVRDREGFDRVRQMRSMPDDVVTQAEKTCARVRELVELRAEPFGHVGQEWLSRFLAESDSA